MCVVRLTVKAPIPKALHVSGLRAKQRAVVVNLARASLASATARKVRYDLVGMTCSALTGSIRNAVHTAVASQATRHLSAGQYRCAVAAPGIWLRGGAMHENRLTYEYFYVDIYILGSRGTHCQAARCQMRTVNHAHLPCIA